jgi:prepilin-type N-terminal cleavage/methylation domain-containing protein
MSFKPRSFDHRGFSLIELMVVVALTGVVAAISVPMMGNSLGFFRLSGDARSTASAVSLGKMRAAATFGRVRLYVDRTGRSFHLETWDKTTSTWLADGGTSYLSQNVSFSYGIVGTAPPNTQGTIGEAAACKSNAVIPVDIANTACVIFNSRGVPIDSTAAGNPIVDALYLTDGTAVYGVTVSATGMVRTWRTWPVVTPAWVLQ